MDYLLSCHDCGEVIIKDDGHEAKIRSKVLLIKGNNADTNVDFPDPCGPMICPRH